MGSVHDARKRATIAALVSLTLLLTLALGACASTDVSQGADAYQITITAPSDENGPVTPGHGFFIAGDITGSQTLPEDVSLRVSVLDGNGEEVRFAESNVKDNDQIDRFCDGFFYYADDVDPERSEVRASEFPFLIVDGSEGSLQNANIKCWFTENRFNSFIPFATDVEHGLLIDDGVGYTDSKGNPYDALAEGTYTAVATLKDASGTTLAEGRKEFAIKPAENAILCRFHPDEHYERMMDFAAEKNLSMEVDNLPGYFRDSNGNDRGGMRAMFIGADCALYNGSKVTMFEYLASPTSTSFVFELPFIERYFDVDDPDRFCVYHYDIGEPSIKVGDETLEGTPVLAEAEDKLDLCRADLAIGAQEGFIDFNDYEIASVDTDFSDGIALEPSEGADFAISGIVIPYQLEDDEIAFDPQKNETGLLNGVANIVYEVWDGRQTKTYVKPVTLTRTLEDGSVYDSVMEFYHVFTADEIDPAKDYEVTLHATDRNGERIAGTTEHFVVNETPDAEIE